LSLGLCCYETAIVAYVEHIFCVVGLVVGPDETLAVVRIEVHDYLGEMAVAIEDHLGGVTWYFGDPVERLHGEYVSAEPDASIPNKNV
jgi:hypothetical protein